MSNISGSKKLVKNKLSLLEPVKTPGNVPQAYKIIRYSRKTFHFYKELYEKEGKFALQDISRKIHINCVGGIGH